MMKTDILSMLRKSDGYVSGQQLCERFHVSRTAVWKVMEQLKEEGYRIEAVRSRGYRLSESPDILSVAEIESRISTRWAGRNVSSFRETDSTNVQARRLGEAGAPHGTLVAADAQSGGRGRRGRQWESPPGRDIYMSLLLRPQIPAAQAPMLTLVMALAVADALREQTGVDARIKWPNDIVARGRKLCGILTEMSADMDGVRYVVIGVGINVNGTGFPEEIQERATSLALESGRRFLRPALIAAVLEKFEARYDKFMKEGDLSGLRDDYNALLVNVGEQVRILEPGHEYNAISSGINGKGELLVTREDGRQEAVFAGEVSVRGIYGYV
ncbi:biotin--[acetyl-CoA-carboxylase] ligase [Mordavella massiliensis]